MGGGETRELGLAVQELRSGVTNVMLDLRDPGEREGWDDFRQLLARRATTRRSLQRRVRRQLASMHVGAVTLMPFDRSRPW